jgi:hypothetical protein
MRVGKLVTVVSALALVGVVGLLSYHAIGEEKSVVKPQSVDQQSTLPGPTGGLGHVCQKPTNPNEKCFKPRPKYFEMLKNIRLKSELVTKEMAKRKPNLTALKRHTDLLNKLIKDFDDQFCNMRMLMGNLTDCDTGN